MLVLYLHDEPNTLVVFAASCPICSSLILQQVLIRKQLLLSSMLQLASLMELYFEHASVCAGGCVAYQHMTCNSAAGGAVFPCANWCHSSAQVSHSAPMVIVMNSSLPQSLSQTAVIFSLFTGSLFSAW